MKMLLSVAQDLRVIIIKFADRLHNMKTIDYMPQIKNIELLLKHVIFTSHLLIEWACPL